MGDADDVHDANDAGDADDAADAPFDGAGDVRPFSRHDSLLFAQCRS